MYYVTDYWTDEIIDVTDDFETAKMICDAHEGYQVETENDEIIYENILLPF